MSMMQSGTHTLVKLENQDDGERFMIVIVDPQQSSRKGYLWSSSEPMTEVEASHRLADLGVESSNHEALFELARKHWEDGQA